jgi:hypothetical protein
MRSHRHRDGFAFNENVSFESSLSEVHDFVIVESVQANRLLQNLVNVEQVLRTH